MRFAFTPKRIGGAPRSGAGQTLKSQGSGTEVRWDFKAPGAPKRDAVGRTMSWQLAEEGYKRAIMVRGAFPPLVAVSALLTTPCPALSPVEKAAFASFAGVYSGAINGGSPESSGTIRIAVNGLGRGTATLKLNGAPQITATVSEVRKADGAVSVQLVPKAGVNLTADLALTKMDGISSVNGTVTVNGRTSPVSMSKLVTKAIPQGWTFQLVNGGGAIGIGAVRIERNARVTGRVQLAEMPGATFTTTLKENGKVPVNLAFGSAASGAKLSGDLSFPTGTLSAEDRSTGATSTITVRGSRYNPLAPALGRRSGSITLQGTDVSGYVVYQAPAKFLNAGFWGFEEGNSAQPRLSLNSALGTISISALNWQPETSLGVVDQSAGTVSFVTSFSSVMTGSLPGRIAPGGRPSGSSSTSATTASGSTVSVAGGTVNPGASVGTGSSGIVTTGGSKLTIGSGSSNSGTPSGGTLIIVIPSSGYEVEYSDNYPISLVAVSTVPAVLHVPASGGTLQMSSSTSSPNLGGTSSITAAVTIANPASWVTGGATISFGDPDESGTSINPTAPLSHPTGTMSLGNAVQILDLNVRPGAQVGDVFTWDAQTFRILEVTSAGYRVEAVP